ncbi:MAG: NTP transferase domain-containing protein [Erysipelotrichaceae bacterium]|nr:NTP transferase domain-containing protein [Erysipelotrichaceae bacterium]
MNINVDNAIIMAAGMSSRFAPISYEKPKALIQVKNEVLIERQIKQLQSAGINDITIITGYKAEQFEYLKEKFNIKTLYNQNYNTHNNHYSLYIAKDLLKNTYICSADNYFTQNPFTATVDEAYYSSIYKNGQTDEWCITYDQNNYITDVTIGGENQWIMLGHAFFSNSFSQKFKSILEKEINLKITQDKLWESIYLEHINELKMKINKYQENQIFEFDSLDELREFDHKYINDTQSKILKSISNTLKIEEKDIINIKPIKQGNQAIGIQFNANNKTFTYNYQTKLLEGENQ